MQTEETQILIPPPPPMPEAPKKKPSKAWWVVAALVVAGVISQFGGGSSRTQAAPEGPSAFEKCRATGGSLINGVCRMVNESEPTTPVEPEMTLSEAATAASVEVDAAVDAAGDALRESSHGDFDAAATSLDEVAYHYDTAADLIAPFRPESASYDHMAADAYRDAATALRAGDIEKATSLLEIGTGYIQEATKAL